MLRQLMECHILSILLKCQIESPGFESLKIRNVHWRWPFQNRLRKSRGANEQTFSFKKKMILRLSLSTPKVCSFAPLYFCNLFWQAQAPVRLQNYTSVLPSFWSIGRRFFLEFRDFALLHKRSGKVCRICYSQGPTTLFCTIPNILRPELPNCRK